MSDSATIIRDGEASCRLQITHRDWMLTCGPGFGEGPAFTTAFGIFENYTVAGGIPKGSLVHRNGKTLFQATEALLRGFQRDYDLIRYDYSCKVGNEPKQYGGGQSVFVNGRRGILSLRPKGYCSIQWSGSGSETSKTELIDLRQSTGILTDSGPIKVYRRKAKSRWLEILPPVLAFLVTRFNNTLSLEHIDRVV